MEVLWVDAAHAFIIRVRGKDAPESYSTREEFNRRAESLGEQGLDYSYRGPGFRGGSWRMSAAELETWNSIPSVPTSVRHFLAH